ncbi:MAG: hypothetical protein JO070_09650 [Verrucomicrobia bacterium]|nr:hypothetical protein [Verrucomicrobiota bacterium]
MSSSIFAAGDFLRASPQKSPAGRLLKSLFLKLTIPNKLFLNSSSQKTAEFTGVAGGFCCLSLHRSQISEEL